MILDINPINTLTGLGNAFAKALSTVRMAPLIFLHLRNNCATTHILDRQTIQVVR